MIKRDLFFAALGAASVVGGLSLAHAFGESTEYTSFECATSGRFSFSVDRFAGSRVIQTIVRENGDITGIFTDPNGGFDIKVDAIKSNYDCLGPDSPKT